MKKEWVAEFQGHQIRVTNAWVGGAKLYIDGDCRDSNHERIVRANTPVLSAHIEHGKTDSPLVEVFIKAILTVKAKICVNGKQIAGDVF